MGESWEKIKSEVLRHKGRFVFLYQGGCLPVCIYERRLDGPDDYYSSADCDTGYDGPDYDNFDWEDHYFDKHGC